MIIESWLVTVGHGCFVSGWVSESWDDELLTCKWQSYSQYFYRLSLSGFK